MKFVMCFGKVHFLKFTPLLQFLQVSIFTKNYPARFEFNKKKLFFGFLYINDSEIIDAIEITVYGIFPVEAATPYFL